MHGYCKEFLDGYLIINYHHFFLLERYLCTISTGFAIPKIQTLYEEIQAQLPVRSTLVSELKFANNIFLANNLHCCHLTQFHYI